MFVPRKHTPVKPQKRRSWVATSLKVFKVQGFKFWPGIFTLNSGYMALRLIEYIYIWLKKATKYPTSFVRFWVNLQANIEVTRKPENVRMGKGKGTRKGMRAFVHAGTFLFRVTSLRKGAMLFFLKKLQARLPLKLRLYSSIENLGFCGQAYTWVQHHMVQRKYIVSQLDTYKGLLKKMHRPLILGYILRIFWWRYIVPHAVWSPVKSTVFKLRVRRKYLRRRKILLFIKPQSLGFLRQLRTKYKQYLLYKQNFKKNIWQKLQVRWIYPVRNVNLFRFSPFLPWDVLLRAKRFKRILFYLNFISFSPLVQIYSQKKDRIWFPLGVNEGFNLPTRLHKVTKAQLRVATMLVHWRYLISRPFNFFTLF